MSSRRGFRRSVNGVQRPNGAGCRGEGSATQKQTEGGEGKILPRRAEDYSSRKPVSFVSLQERYWAKSRSFFPLRPTFTVLIGPSPSVSQHVSLAFQTMKFKHSPLRLISLSISHCFNIFTSPGFPFKALFSGLDTFWGKLGRSCIGGGSSEAKMLLLRRLYRNFIFHVRGPVLNVWQTRSVQLFPPDITLS